MLITRRRLPLPAVPDAPLERLSVTDMDAEDDEREVTAPHIDPPRVLSELLALVSRTESLASAAERVLDLLPSGPTAGYARRAQRLVDLMIAMRESALHALEVGETLDATLRPALAGRRLNHDARGLVSRAG